MAAERTGIKYFEKLGNAIQFEWRSKNFRYSVFPEIAYRLLKENPPNIDYQDVVRWALTTDTLPEQDPTSDFGQPPLRVFRGPLFYIEVLFWLQGTTSIHQHGFSGAFQVLAGSSIQSVYQFRKRESISARFVLGELSLKNTEYVSAGDTHRIYAGSQFIHSLFHLDHPSVTVVVRTYKEPDSGPQYDYRPPFLALDPFAHPPLMKRRLQLLDMLQQTSPRRYRQHLGRLVSDSDIETTYFVLRHSYAHISEKQFQAIIEKAQKRHGTMIDLIVAVLQEEFRKGRLISLRSTIKDPEHRFFLALLMNLRNRKAIQQFIRKRYSGNPDQWIRKWMQELTKSQASLGRNNLLGIFWDEVAETMMRLMISGLKFPSIVREFQRIHSITEVSLHKKLQLYLLYSSFRSSIFKPLLQTRDKFPRLSLSKTTI